MIDIPDYDGKTVFEAISRPLLICAIHEYGRIIAKIVGDRIRSKKLHSLHEEQETAWDYVVVDANDVVTRRLQHAPQRNLRSDTITVRTSMPDDRHLSALQPFQQLREFRRKLVVELLHSYGALGGNDSEDFEEISSSTRSIRVPCSTD